MNKATSSRKLFVVILRQGGEEVTKGPFRGGSPELQSAIKGANGHYELKACKGPNGSNRNGSRKGSPRTIRRTRNNRHRHCQV